MLWIAFIIGILLQLFVIETPGVQEVFNTTNLNGIEWLITSSLSILPLLIHELCVFLNWIRKK